MRDSLTRKDVVMIRLTVIVDMVTLRSASTGTTVSMDKKARAEYDSYRTFDGEEKKIVYLFTVTITVRKVM